MKIWLRIPYFFFSLVTILVSLILVAGFFSGPTPGTDLLIVLAVLFIFSLSMSVGLLLYGLEFLPANIFSHSVLFFIIVSILLYFVSPVALFWFFCLLISILLFLVSIIVSIRKKFLTLHTIQPTMELENKMDATNRMANEIAPVAGNSSMFTKTIPLRVIFFTQGLFLFAITYLMYSTYGHLTDFLPLIFGLIYVVLTFLPINKLIKISLYFSAAYSIMYFLIMVNGYLGYIFGLPAIICFFLMVFLLILGFVSGVTNKFFYKNNQDTLSQVVAGNPVAGKRMFMDVLFTFLILAIIFLVIPYTLSAVASKRYQNDKTIQEDALQQGDSSLCDKINNISLKDGCYWGLAKEIKNPLLCKKISEWAWNHIDSCIINALDAETFSKNEEFYRNYCTSTQSFDGKKKCKDFLNLQ